MELTQRDRDSDTWEKLHAYLTERLDELRRKNDNDMGEIETARLRGQIREVKGLLALGNEKPEFNSPGAKK